MFFYPNKKINKDKYFTASLGIMFYWNVSGFSDSLFITYIKLIGYLTFTNTNHLKSTYNVMFSYFDLCYQTMINRHTCSIQADSNISTPSIS